jgi:hypothetical protein
MSIVSEIKQSSQFFMRNNRDSMVVDPYKAKKRYTVTETLFLCTRRKFGFNKKIRTKLAFRPQQKTDTTA